MNGKTIYFLGKLAASNRKEAAEIVRRGGGKVAQKLSPGVQMVVVGEGDVLARDWNLWNDQLDAATRDAFEAGTLEIVSETFFWDKFGDVHDAESTKSSAPHYTPSMLAELTGLPVAMIRQLQNQQMIIPVRQVHRLAYFDAESILPLKIVRNMLDAGLSLNAATDRLRKIKRHLPDGLTDVRIEGKDILIVTKNGTVDHNGQLRFSFVMEEESQQRSQQEPHQKSQELREQKEALEILETVFEPGEERNDSVTLTEAAWTLESSGDLQGAVDLYRAAIAAGGPNPQINFQIAELLYRLGDLTAAREQYFMAVELDETFVEARANLGCVLAELGNDDLAAAAFRGALKIHPDYAEVRYYLGMLLKRVGLTEEAEEHFRIFLELMPDSPWAKNIVL